MNLPSMIFSGDPIEKPPVGLRIEDRIPMVKEAGGEQIDASKDLDALSGSRDGNQGLMPSARPGGMKRRVLTKGSFVFED